MAKKKTKIKHHSKAKHRFKDRSALTCWTPLYCPRFNNHTIRRWATKRAAARIKATQPQPKTVSLLDLPLEFLWMIFDHVTCRERRKRHRYTIQVVPQGASIDNMAISQHPLLMVCSSLRSRLISYFYSISSFHVEVHMSSTIRNNQGILDLRELQENILHERKLSSVKLTINIYKLSRKFFDYSVLVQMGTILFEDYRAKRLVSRYDGELVKLRWRLKCNDPEFECPCPRYFVEQDLKRLLDKIHKWAAKAAIHTSKSSQAFSSKLERWLKTQEGVVDRTYNIRRTLDECLKATSVWDRRLAIDSCYGNVCFCG
ncbi:hypothetical protein KCU91_g10544, partial [Aureobasidium melanogenum]